MTIEIIETKIVQQPIPSRVVSISITDGVDTYLWRVGGLPTTGDLQTILDARESGLWAAASANGVTFDVFEITERRVLKSFALVVLDELNTHSSKINEILDAMDAATSLADLKTRILAVVDLPLRDESQIRGAIKNKLQG